MKATRIDIALLAGFQCALLVGCPAPTGRRRGPLDPDAGCSVVTRPVTGESCGTSSTTCEFEAPCELDPADPNLSQLDRCACVGGRWRCTSVDGCLRAGVDGGAACPSIDESRPASFVCSARQRDLRCTLPLFTCPDGSRPPLACRCDGSFWQCEPARCAGEEPDGGGVGSAAGQPCEDDGACRAPLRCERGAIAGNFCTTSCLQDPQPSREAAQCGGGNTTCLTDGTPGVGRCTSACRTGVPGSGCRPGFACTGRWFAQEEPDGPGCAPFCAIDAHCPAAIACNPRTGVCGEAPNPIGLADGSPCRPSERNPCRGLCLQIREGSPVGLCGSLVDLERSAGCPDDPSMPFINPGSDNLALCVLSPCSASRCCPASLVCEELGGQGVCVPDDPATPNIACAGGAPDGGPRDAATDAR